MVGEVLRWFGVFLFVLVGWFDFFLVRVGMGACVGMGCGLVCGDMSWVYEDELRHVVVKGARGVGLALGVLREKLGMGEDGWRDFLAGSGDLLEWERCLVAGELGLDEEALVGYGRDVCVVGDVVVGVGGGVGGLPEGIFRGELGFEGDGVNVWLLERDGVRILVDGGFHAGEAREFLRRRGVGRVDVWLVTHDHRDHVGDVEGWGEVAERLFVPWEWVFSRGGGEGRFVGAERAVGEWVELGGVGGMGEGGGRGGDFGGLAVRGFFLGGHCRGAVGYEIRGFGRPVVAVGDAIFAGSVGGCVDEVAFGEARERIFREVLGCFGSDLLILPGHGPATCLGDELVRNPFLAGWARGV